MLQKNITYQSSTIFYQTVGNGKPVVLLHGFAEDGEIWENQINFLKAHYFLIIPSLPGTNQSALIATMSIDGMAEVVKEILVAEKVNTCAIIGHSMGGYITLALAEKYPQLINAFGLFHSSAYADSEEKKIARLKAINFIKHNGAYEFLKTSIPGLFMPQSSEEPSNALITNTCNALIEKGKHFTPEVLIHYYQAMIGRPDRTEVLKNFLHPILFIMGEHDVAVPFTQSMQQSYLPNTSYIIILRNSAHMGMWEETNKANTALLAFLQGQSW